MTSIDIPIKKIDEFIDKINNLMKKHYSQVADDVLELDMGIRGLIKALFQNDYNERLLEYDRYKYFPRYAPDYPRESVDPRKINIEQNRYVSFIKAKRNLLISYKDEILLKNEMDSKDIKASSLHKKINKTRMESERRNNVVESKVSGAYIELLDMLRDELRERRKSGTNIIKIEKRLNGIGDKLDEILNTVKHIVSSVG
jgi:hypothetical protein